MEERVERSGGWAGIAYIVVVLIAAIVPGIPPAPDSPIATVTAYVNDHRMPWLLAGWLIFPGTAFYLWWLVQLARFIRRNGDPEGLTHYFTAAGIVTSVLVLMLALSQILMGLRPDADASVMQLLFDAFNGIGGLLFMPLCIAVFAAARGAHRHRAFSTPLVIWSYVTAAGCGLSTLSVFSLHGFAAVGGVGTAVFGLLPFGVWGIWTSIEMIRKA
jgi:hypothetical protein